MATGISRDKKREEAARIVELTTPHGTEVLVSAKRAEALMARPPLRMGDNTLRVYAPLGEDNEIEAPTTGAKPPRKGTGVNSGDDA